MLYYEQRTEVPRVAAKFQLKQAKNSEFYFNLKAGNGQTILTSEFYKAKASALNGIESVKKNAPMAERYENLTSTNDKPYFVLKAGNHEIIGRSELYESEDARANGIESVKTNAPVAETEEVATA